MKIEIKTGKRENENEGAKTEGYLVEIFANCGRNQK